MSWTTTRIVIVTCCTSYAYQQFIQLLSEQFYHQLTKNSCVLTTSDQATQLSAECSMTVQCSIKYTAWYTLQLTWAELVSAVLRPLLVAARLMLSRIPAFNLAATVLSVRAQQCDFSQCKQVCGQWHWLQCAVFRARKQPLHALFYRILMYSKSWSTGSHSFL